VAGNCRWPPLLRVLKNHNIRCWTTLPQWGNFYNHYKANINKPLQKKNYNFSNSPCGRLGSSRRSTGRPRSTGWALLSSDVVDTITFETETWLKFRDKTETSSKTVRPRLETWSSRPRPKLETSKFVHFAEIFQKNVIIASDHGRPQGGGTGIPPPWDCN